MTIQEKINEINNSTSLTEEVKAKLIEGLLGASNNGHQPTMGEIIDREAQGVPSTPKGSWSNTPYT